MSLQLLPIQSTLHCQELRALITRFNEIPANAYSQQLFYLQKMNRLLDSTPLNKDLLHWINASGPTSWQHHLLSYSINPSAGFFLKEIQFAQAVSLHNSDITLIESSENEYELMQRHNKLLQNSSFESCALEYVSVCCQLGKLAKTNHRIKKMITTHSHILCLAHDKIESLKGKTVTQSILFAECSETELLFQVKESLNLQLEYQLRSFEVAQFFKDDLAIVRVAVISPEGEPAYKQMVLNQPANQGALCETAKRLRGSPDKIVAATAGYYFSQLIDFCKALMDAQTYHPDIRLIDFSVHNSRIFINPTPLFTTNENPKVNEFSKTPLYVPKEYLKCLNKRTHDFNYRASITTMNLPQLMAFQLGMVLKEFLILTQLDLLPDDFVSSNRCAASYFDSPTKQIINLSLLAQELTRQAPDKRMSIAQLHSLIKLRNYAPETFYAAVEKRLPSESIGMQEQINALNSLLKSNSTIETIISEANLAFKHISKHYPNETRLVRIAEQLAIKCFKEYSKNYVSQLSKAIETAIFNTDWKASTWYRKALYVLSCGFYNIERVTQVSTVSLPCDFQGEEFQTHVPHLEFLPFIEIKKHLGQQKAENFKEFIITHRFEIIPQDCKKCDELETENATETESLSYSPIQLRENASPKNASKATPTTHDNLRQRFFPAQITTPKQQLKTPSNNRKIKFAPTSSQ